MIFRFDKRKAGGESCLFNCVSSIRRKVQETHRPTCLDLHRYCRTTGGIEITRIAVFCNSVGFQIFDDPIRTIGRVPDIFSVWINDRDSELEQGIFRCAFSCHHLFKLQPAPAVIPCAQHVAALTG